MAIKTWTATGTKSWSTAGSWSTSGQPGASDTALFNVGGAAYVATYNTSSTIAALTINDASATVQWQLNNVRVMTVSGATTLQAGTLSLLPGKAGSALNTNSLSVSGGSFLSDKTIAVTGLASFTGGTNIISGGTFSTGTLAVGTGVTLTLSGSSTTTTTAGGVDIADNATIAITSSTLNGTTTGLGNEGEIKGSGTVTGVLSATGNGVVEANSGTLVLTSALDDDEIFVEVAGSSVLQLDGVLGDNQTFSFLDSATGEFRYNNATNDTDLNISGFNVGSSNSTPTNFFHFAQYQVVIKGSNAGTGASGTIELTDGSVLTLSGITNGGGGWFSNVVSDGGSGSLLFLSTVVCYAKGTRILTPTGEVAVETIQPGDAVITLDGDASVPQSVKWVGERRVNIAGHPRPELVAPVRIRQGAFGENRPQRDLVVSPDHCLLVDGKLVPAKLLINGMTIVQQRDIASVHYYHVELDRHAVLLAEGLPAESYLDTGNRAYFSNSNLALVLHPEFEVNASLRC